MCRLWATLALLGATALIAGCGGGDDDGGLTTSDISKADYIKQADEVCAKSDQKLQKEAGAYFATLGLGPNEEPTEKQIASFAESSLVPNVQQQLDDLQALEAPADDAEQIAKVYDTAQEELDAISDDPGSAATGKAFAKANELAQTYGFEVCGAG